MILPTTQTFGSSLLQEDLLNVRVTLLPGHQQRIRVPSYRVDVGAVREQQLQGRRR